MPEPTATSTESPDRKSAIAAAISSVPLPEGAENTDPPVVDDPPPPAEPKKEGKENPPAPTRSETEIANALQLFDALNDPNRAGAVIKYLADQAGITKGGDNQPATKAEARQAEQTIIDVLKENLGEEFGFLADKLGPAIEKIVNKSLEQSQADIRSQLQAAEQEKLQGQSVNAINKLSNDFFGADKGMPEEVANLMSSLMDKMPPTPDMDIKEYTDLIFHTAVGKLGLTKAKAPVAAARVQQNRNDAASRLASERTVPGQPEVDKNKVMSRKEAIRAALDAIERGGGNA
jgi:hypothetical protein